MAVGFARIYYHCHYMGDVVVGCLLGTQLGVLLHKIGFKIMLKTLFLKVMPSGGSSGDVDDFESDF